jgi:hypothetical protein
MPCALGAAQFSIVLPAAHWRVPIGGPVNTTANLHRFKWALAMILLGLNIAAGEAVDRRDLLGTWYGETQDRGEVGGLPFDARRWTIVQTSDGTGMQVMRYYLNSRFQTERVMSYMWGVDNDVWWVECVTARDDRGLQDCSRTPRTDYRIDSLDSAGLRYTSVSFGRSYFMRKVPRDFTIPR